MRGERGGGGEPPIQDNKAQVKMGHIINISHNTLGPGQVLIC